MTKVTITYEGKNYTLAYSRESVRMIEQTGFDIGKIESMPASMIPQLFFGAFAMYHKGIKRKLVDEIWKSTPNKNDLIVVLVEMYGETIEDLLGDNEDNTKNATWEVSQ